jgi:hypothetical protein
VDEARPWGGFFVIDPSTGSGQARDFLRAFFPDEDAEALATQTISPKILVVAPGACACRGNTTIAARSCGVCSKDP